MIHISTQPEMKGKKPSMIFGRKYASSSQARHIQVNISSRGVAPDLFMPSARGSWEKSASCLVQLAEMYPETLFLVPVFQPFGDFSKRLSPNLGKIIFAH